MIQPRPYQVKAVEALANSRLGFLHAAAGSGKTATAAMAIHMAEIAHLRPLHVVWLAPTVEIRDQGEKSCKLAELRGTQEFHCWQGMEKIPDCDILIVDECHAVAAPCYKALLRSTLEKVDGRWQRRCITWGLTATPDREDGESIVPIIGPCIHHIPKEDIREAGGVLPCKVYVRQYEQEGLAEEIERAARAEIKSWMSDEQVSRVVWRHALKLGVTDNQGRHAFVAGIVAKAVKSGASVICLADTVDACKAIAELVPGAVPTYSGMGTRLRSETMQGFRAGEIPCIVATSLADEGMDAPIASVLVLARAGKAKGRLEQRAGRVLRAYPGKEYGVLVDVFDRAHKMLEVQHWRRMRCYKEWGFEIFS